jgi:hypothetical protein
MIEGGCFCGAVRYQIDGALDRACACHCSRCRKVFSGASSAYAEIADGSKFSWVTGEDELTKHTSAQGWGIAFCRICGSTLCGIFDGKVHGVTLGTVDGDPGVQIEMHTFVGSKAPWDHIGGSAPQFKEEPPNSNTSRVIK